MVNSGCRKRVIAIHNSPVTIHDSLPFVFSFAEFFVNSEPGFFRVGDGEWLEFDGRMESGEHFPHGFFAGGAVRQRLCRKRAVQREFSAAYLAIAFAQFIFVNRHTKISNVE